MRVNRVQIGAPRHFTKRGVAGRSAREIFNKQLHAWRKRLWWRVFLISVLPAVCFLTLAALINGQAKVYLGAAGGASLSLYLWFRDSPPAHIENWRTGSDGERRTDKVLRPLKQDGWHIWHDVGRPSGANIDHVVVGPPGVFLLDTKNYLGEARIEDGELKVAWLEAPDHGWICDGLPGRMRSASAELSDRIEQLSGRRCWVQPVVVLWQPFPERIAEVHGPSVYFVHGDELAVWLRSRPPRRWFAWKRTAELLDKAFT